MVESALTVKLFIVLPVIIMFRPFIYYKIYPKEEIVAMLKPEVGVLDGFVLPVTVTINV